MYPNRRRVCCFNIKQQRCDDVAHDQDGEIRCDIVGPDITELSIAKVTRVDWLEISLEDV